MSNRWQNFTSYRLPTFDGIWNPCQSRLIWFKFQYLYKTNIINEVCEYMSERDTIWSINLAAPASLVLPATIPYPTSTVLVSMFRFPFFVTRLKKHKAKNTNKLEHIGSWLHENPQLWMVCRKHQCLSPSISMRPYVEPPHRCRSTSFGRCFGCLGDSAIWLVQVD